MDEKNHTQLKWCIGILTCAFILVFVIGMNPFLQSYLFPRHYWYDAKRALEGGFFILTSLYLLCLPQLRDTCLTAFSSMTRTNRWLISAFFFIGLLSTLHVHTHHATSWLIYCQYLFMLITALTFMGCYQALPRFTTCCFLVALSIIIASYTLFYWFVFFQNYHSILAPNNPFKAGSFPGFQNPRWFSQMYVMLLPFCALPLLTRIKIAWKIPLFIALSFFAAFFFINTSRGALIATLLALILIGLLFKKSTFKYITIQVSLLIVGLLLYLTLFQVVSFAHFSWQNSIPANMARIVSNNYTNRLVMWHYAFNLGLSHPLLGVGPGHYALFPDWNTPLMATMHAHPHNFLALILSEWGFIASLIMLYFFFLQGKKIVNTQQSNTTQQIIHSIQVAALLAIAFYSMVSAVLISPLSQLFSTVIIASFAAVIKNQQGNMHIVKARYHALFIGCILLLLLIYCCFFWTQFNGLYTRELLFLKIHLLKAFAPRFWLQGFITN